MLNQEITQVTEKRKDLEYQIRVTQQEGKLIEDEFQAKTEALKNMK